MTARGHTMGTLVPIMKPPGLADQLGHLLCSSLVSLDHRVVVPGVHVAAGVAGLAHRDVLADLGVVHQADSGMPSALMELDHRDACRLRQLLESLGHVVQVPRPAVVAQKLGIGSSETLQKWIRQAEANGRKTADSRYS